MKEIHGLRAFDNTAMVVRSLACNDKLKTGDAVPQSSAVSSGLAMGLGMMSIIIFLLSDCNVSIDYSKTNSFKLIWRFTC